MNTNRITALAAKTFGVPYDKVTPEMRRAIKAREFGATYGGNAFSLRNEMGTVTGRMDTSSRPNTSAEPKSDDFTFSVTVTWKVEPSDYLGHSYIVERKLSPIFDDAVKYGPIPDVLIPEVLHEFEQSRKIMMEVLVKDFLGINGGGV
jgi:hypothetical protein